MSDSFALVNYGGSFQLDISSAKDLEALSLMDEVFWMATSAPTFQLNCSDELIHILDNDQNGRILSSDLRSASDFLLSNLKNHQRIDQRSAFLSALDLSDQQHAQKLKEAALEILENLGKDTNSELSLEDLDNVSGIYKNGLSNGDGVIPPENIEDEEVRAFCKDIISCLGAVKDINDKEGVNTDKIQSFIKSANEYIAWKDSKSYSADILPLHERTPEAFKIFSEMRPKIDAYFESCKLHSFNRSLEKKTLNTDCPAEIDNNKSATLDYLRTAPIAPVNHESKLNLNEHINPYYQEKIVLLSKKVLDEFLARPVEYLIESQWLKVCDIFKPYEQWLESCQGYEVNSIDEIKLKQYLNGNIPEKLHKLIDQDLLLGEKLKLRSDLKKLIILQKEFLDFCNNFVSFPHLYNPEKRAIFETGRLVIDGRIFNFNIPVEDVQQHSKLAQKSGIYIMYLEVTGAEKDKTFHICTPVTSRRLGLLGVNKRGVLFDLNGIEWDAKVIKVLNNPVSLTEAIIAPFKKFSQLIIDAVDKISNSTEKHFEKKIQQTGSNIQKNLTTPQTGAINKKDANNTARDLMLTGSVTFAALGSSFAYISSTFSSMNWEHRMATLSIGLLIIIVPVVMVAAIKLYRRNISSILEASGWAINAHMRLTGKLAAILAPKPDSPGRVFRKKRDLLKGFSNKFKFQIKRK